MLDKIKKLIKTEVYSCFRGSRSNTLGGKVLMSTDGKTVVAVSRNSEKGTVVTWFHRCTNEVGNTDYEIIASVTDLITKADVKDSIAMSDDGITLAIACVVDGRKGLNIYKVTDIGDDLSSVVLHDRIVADSLMTRRYGESITISKDGTTVATVGMLVNGFIIVYFYDLIKNKYRLRRANTEKGTVGGNIVVPISDAKRYKLDNDHTSVALVKGSITVPDYSAKVVMSDDGKQVGVLINRIEEGGGLLLVLLTYVYEDGVYNHIEATEIAGPISVNDANICMSRVGNRVVVSIPKLNTVYSAGLENGTINNTTSSKLMVNDEYVGFGNSLALSGDGNTLCIVEAGTLELDPKYFLYEFEDTKWKYLGMMNGSPANFRLFSETSVALDYHGVTMVTGEQGCNAFKNDGSLSLGAIQIINL